MAHLYKRDQESEILKKTEDWHRRSDAARKGWETRRLKNYLKSKEI
jgi:hypothetical protein